MDNLHEYVTKFASGALSGQDLAQLVASGTLNKSQRRSIQKAAAKISTSTVKGGSLTLPVKNTLVKDERCLSDSIVSVSKKRSAEQEHDRVKPNAKANGQACYKCGMESCVIGSAQRAKCENDADDDDSSDAIEASEDDNDNKSEVQFTPKQLKMKLKLLNKELAAFAIKKQLHEAKKRLQAGIRRGLRPDVHTFSNLINCYVRCGDVAGAQRVMTIDMPAAGVALNAVTLTTLLKGFCEHGDMKTARRILFQEMAKLPASEAGIGSNNRPVGSTPPNNRAVLTYLRGCARTGAVGLAEEALGALGDIPESFSMSARAHVVSLLCQAIKLSSAVRLANSIPAPTSSSASAAAVDGLAMQYVSACLSLGQVHALLGRLVEASQWARKARACLDAEKGNSLLQAMQRHSYSHSHGGSSGEPISEAAMSAAAAATGAQSSAELFTAHQRGELMADITVLDNFIQKYMVPSVQLKNHFGANRATGDRQLKERLLKQLGQTLIFGYDGQGDLNRSGMAKDTNMDKQLDPKDIAAALLQSLQEKFGLNSESLASGELLALRTAVEEKVARCVDTSVGHIDWQALFAEVSVGVSDGKNRNTASLPIKMEICSGMGDWVVRQARADVGRANWAALELRCDRSNMALKKYLLSSASESDRSIGTGTGTSSNLAIISGDAAHVMHRHVAPNSVAALFVNHPEPPERSMSVDKRARARVGENGPAQNGDASSGNSVVQGKHLLTSEFLQDCCRSLLIGPKDGELEVIPEKTGQSGKRKQSKQRHAGCLTIVTDSLPYAKILADILAAMPPVVLEDADVEEKEDSAHSDAARKRRRTDSGADNGQTKSDSNVSQHPRYVFQSVPLGGDDDDDDDDDGDVSIDGQGAVGAGGTKLEHRVPLTSHDPRVSSTRLGGSTRTNVISVWRGDIVTAGIRDVVSASSYFDRMWSAGNQKRRWFIYVRKVRI